MGMKLVAGDVVGKWKVNAELESGYRVRCADGNPAELLFVELSEEQKERFAHLQELEHENVVAQYEIVEYEGETALVRQLVTGQTFAQWLANEVQPSWDQVLGVACQLCLASTILGKHEIDYVGFQPDALVITPDGFALVDPLMLERKTDEAYQAPEEQKGNRNQRSDVYRIAKFIEKTLSASDLPRIQEVIDKATTANESDRYQTADDLLNQLHSLLTQKFVDPNLPPDKWHQDKRLWLYLAIGLAVGAIAMSLLEKLLF
jgi:hypothetical protein